MEGNIDFKHHPIKKGLPKQTFLNDIELLSSKTVHLL